MGKDLPEKARAKSLTLFGWYDKLGVVRERESTHSGAWCSGLTCGPVKAETAGSNPVAPAVTTSFLSTQKGEESQSRLEGQNGTASQKDYFDN